MISLRFSKDSAAPARYFPCFLPNGREKLPQKRYLFGLPVPPVQRIGDQRLELGGDFIPVQPLLPFE